MKWHIVGSNGYIGTKLCTRIPADKRVLSYVPPGTVSREQEIALELTDFDAAALSHIDVGDFVVMLAAVSSPDACERNYIEAHRVNVEGTVRFIRGCIDRGANVLFFSSDVVNGATTPCMVDESYRGTPLGRYAEMKREVEDSFTGHPNFKAFRLSYVYSRSDKFSGYLDACLKSGETAEVFDGLYRCAIYIEDVFEAVIRLEATFAQWENTVFNLSGPKLLSRRDIAMLYKRIVDSRLAIEIIRPPEDFFKARPNVIAAGSLYLEKLLGRTPYSIDDAMRREYGLNNIRNGAEE